MYGWENKPTKATLRHTTDKGRVFQVGGFIITVPDDSEGDVTYRRERNTHEPRKTLPNLEIDEGVVKFYLEDLVEIIFSRLEPHELACELWRDERVVEEFMECLTQKYRGMGDTERRTYLAKIKEEVHDQALDKLADAMSKLEYSMSQRSHFYHSINSINERLRNIGCVDGDGNKLRIEHHDHDPDFKIGGKHWAGARDWWRKEVKRLFPKGEQTET